MSFGTRKLPTKTCCIFNTMSKWKSKKILRLHWPHQIQKNRWFFEVVFNLISNNVYFIHSSLIFLLRLNVVLVSEYTWPMLWIPKSDQIPEAEMNPRAQPVELPRDRVVKDAVLSEMKINFYTFQLRTRFIFWIAKSKGKFQILNIQFNLFFMIYLIIA